MTIDVYNTHIEIRPYEKGKYKALDEKLEKEFEVFDRYAFKTSFEAYMIDGDTLYLPKGVNLTSLMLLTNTDVFPTIHYDYDKYEKIPREYTITRDPNTEIRREAVDFMTSQGKYSKNKANTQYMLNLDVGLGKTYAMVSAIMHYRAKTLIIIYFTSLVQDWINELKASTNIPANKIKFIDDDKTFMDVLEEDSAYVCIITHQRLQAYANANGVDALRNWFRKARFGLKCFDEAHRFFKSILKIDYCSNVYKTFYLTATKGRVDRQQKFIYNQVFKTTSKFGENLPESDEHRKHTNFIAVFFRSHPPAGTIVSTRRGIDHYKYIDYELHNEEQTMLRAYKRIIEQIEELEGRVLVISPKIESCDFIVDYTRKITNKSCYAYHSKKSDAEREVAENADIIASTFGSLGEGRNIKGLRFIICLQAIGSEINIIQLRGRLREYSKELDTYMFYLVDAGIRESTDIYRRVIRPAMTKKAKKMITLEWYDL